MNSKVKTTTGESSALKQAVSQAVRSSNFQLKGTWATRATDHKTSKKKVTITTKK